MITKLHGEERGQPRGTIQVVRTGRVEYLAAWNLQRALVAARRQGAVEDLLLLVEHPPTYTIGRRGSRSNLLIDDAMLASIGATCYVIDRGGDITFHGPGQLVVYAILDLGRHQRRVRRYVEMIETVVIDTLRDYGLEGSIDSKHPGVWIGLEKVAALGIAISHGVTYHGFALNVDPDLRYFEYMIPCGIPDRGATSIARQTGLAATVDDAADQVIRSFIRVFDVEPRYDLSLDDLQRLAASGQSPRADPILRTDW
ncbi:MAG TPA: lipoyl(octanoyl) transferase LipB [Nitrolancea sp.]|nr:lipoyl(octanoyl) transferase LipB [Nitrolancea sp.]